MKGREFITQMTKLVIENQLEESNFDLIIRKVIGSEAPIKLSNAQIKNLRSDGTAIIIEIA